MADDPVRASRRTEAEGKTSAFHALAGCCAAAALFLGALPAFAQSPSQSLGDVPGREPLDPNIDPYPFDAPLALRVYFREALPGGWRAGEPRQEPGGGFSLLVYVPDFWKGNPSSAMMRFCPRPYSNIWRGGVRWIELKPYYRQSYWPTSVCRPGAG